MLFKVANGWASPPNYAQVSTNQPPGKFSHFIVHAFSTYAPNNRFACSVINYANANGKVPLVK
jgi:hypothetical protein